MIAAGNLVCLQVTPDMKAHLLTKTG